MMAAFISYAISFTVFLVCFYFAKSDTGSTQNEDEIEVRRLLLQHQVGEKIFDSYQSALVNQFNQPTLQDVDAFINPKCLVDLTAIAKNSMELLKCK